MNRKRGDISMRRARLLEIIRSSNRTTLDIPQTAELLNVSQVTLRRDLATLYHAGLSVEKGMTVEYYAEVGINNLMISNVSGPVYMLASHTVLNEDSNFVSAAIGVITTLITNKGVLPELLVPFQNLGIEVIVT